MKKRLLSVLLILLTIAVIVLSCTLYQRNQALSEIHESGFYLKTAQILLESYGFTAAPDGAGVIVSPVEEAYGIGNGALNADAERYNLAGIPLDLSEVYPSPIHIGDIYEDSTARWCYIPLSHDSGVALQAEFLFIDDQLSAAYVIVSDPLMPSYLHDAGITDPPPSFWPLDVSKDVLEQDLAIWAEILR